MRSNSKFKAIAQINKAQWYILFQEYYKNIFIPAELPSPNDIGLQKFI